MDRIKENTEAMKTKLREHGVTMYQAVYPWLCRDQFKLRIPGVHNNEMWSIPQRVCIDKLRAADNLHQVEISAQGRLIDLVTDYISTDDMAPGPTIESASNKLIAFINKRDCHEPRLTWRVPVNQLMENFSCWVFRPYVERPSVTATAGSSDATTGSTSNTEELNFVLPSGKSMNLYKYVKWLITTFGHSSRESLIEGALSGADTTAFEKALTHPYFDTVCMKAFAVDQALETMKGFRSIYETMQWEKFEQDDRYLDVDVSLRLYISFFFSPFF
ncbi:hypothetical protein LSAT2_030425 [Lamellibrachia satsuma]|nr:hypothetical protein LSAT2_030425 [Lamellibrachia satsuma]